MEKSGYRFNIGKFECVVVTDGSIRVPPPPEMPAAKGESMDVLSLFINTGKEKIMIDTGCGNSWIPNVGKLPANLKAAGISCDEIDIVTYTHGHMDHAAGTFNAKNQPVFPKARYAVAREEWECWVIPRERPQLSEMFNAARTHLVTIPDQFQLIEDGAEMVPGFRIKLAPGHTPGTTLIELSSEGETLMCIGDLVHSAKEFDTPDYYSFLDVDPPLAIKNRNSILTSLAKSQTLVFAAHFSYPGLGHFQLKNGNLSWKPV
jgi:glyoxylase-like metal-dependent hydrolase (beta-lactamase superfamily II)